MGSTIKNQTTNFSGELNIRELGEIMHPRYNINGADNSDDKLTLSSPKPKTKNKTQENPVWEFDAGSGEDTLDFDMGGSAGSMRNTIVKAVTKTTGWESEYDFFVEGGHETGTATRLFDSMTTYFVNVENVTLPATPDWVNLAAATDHTPHFHGAGGDDTIYGSDYNDNISGGNDDDLIAGYGDRDTLSGGKGHDTIYGGGDFDRLYGGENKDVLYGQGWKDVLNGDSGSDQLFGGEEEDTLIGGVGNDTLSGGTGYDAFVFRPNEGSDVITDIEIGDRIHLNQQYGYTIETVGRDTVITMDGTSILIDETTAFDIELSKVTNNGWSHTLSVVEKEIEPTVICTYMFERGYIPADVYRWDGVYGQRLGAEVLAGYHAWAIPLVERVLKRSELATQLVRPLACAWAQEMAHRCDPESHPKGSVLGTAILTLGVPLCRAIARAKSPKSTATQT